LVAGGGRGEEANAGPADARRVGAACRAGRRRGRHSRRGPAAASRSETVDADSAALVGPCGRTAVRLGAHPAACLAPCCLTPRALRMRGAGAPARCDAHPHAPRRARLLQPLRMRLEPARFPRRARRNAAARAPRWCARACAPVHARPCMRAPAHVHMRITTQCLCARALSLPAAVLGALFQLCLLYPICDGHSKVAWLQRVSNRRSAFVVPASPGTRPHARARAHLHCVNVG